MDEDERYVDEFGFPLPRFKPLDPEKRGQRPLYARKLRPHRKARGGVLHVQDDLSVVEATRANRQPREELAPDVRKRIEKRIVHRRQFSQGGLRR